MEDYEKQFLKELASYSPLNDERFTHELVELTFLYNDTEPWQIPHEARLKIARAKIWGSPLMGENQISEIARRLCSTQETDLVIEALLCAIARGLGQGEGKLDWDDLENIWWCALRLEDHLQRFCIPPVEVDEAAELEKSKREFVRAAQVLMTTDSKLDVLRAAQAIAKACHPHAKGLCWC